MKKPERWYRAAELSSYAALALLLVLPALLVEHGAIGNNVDLVGTFWFYWWIWDSITGWHDPSVTNLQYFPVGKDLFTQMGSNFLDALFAQPFIAVFGYPGFQPWYVAAVLFGNAIAFHPLALYVIGSRWGAWGATVLWLVCPFTLAELVNGRITQAFLWFAPPAVLGIVRALDTGRLRPAIWSGLFLGLVGWSYWYYAYFLVFGFVWIAAMDRGEPWRARARALATSLGVSALVASPAVITMAVKAGQGKIPGMKPPDSFWDVPEVLGTRIFFGPYGEPLFGSVVWGLVGLGGLVVSSRQRLRWLGLVVLFALCAVGPRLVLGEELRIVMPHYVVAMNVLPFLMRLWFPYRILVFAMMVAALGVGLVVARLASWRSWAPPAGVAVLLAISVAEGRTSELIPLHYRPLHPPQTYRWIGEEGGALIEMPVLARREALIWQALHGQPTWGGNGERSPMFWPQGFAARMRNSLIQYLHTATRVEDHQLQVEASDKQRLVDEGFRWVVYDRSPWLEEMNDPFQPAGMTPPDPAVVVDRVTAALGPPVAVEDSLVVWDLVGGAQPPPELRATAERLGKPWRPPTPLPGDRVAKPE